MPDLVDVRSLDKDILDGEIRWLASYGKSNARIARDLRISLATVESHLTGRDRPNP